MCAGEGEEMIFKKRQEYHLQQDVHQWFITQYPKAFQTISPAGIRLPVWIGAKFKGMGYRKGSLDYMIFKMKKLGGVVFGGCFVEIKMPGGATSKECRCRITSRLHRIAQDKRKHLKPVQLRVVSWQA